MVVFWPKILAHGMTSGNTGKNEITGKNESTIKVTTQVNPILPLAFWVESGGFLP